MTLPLVPSLLPITMQLHALFKNATGMGSRKTQFPRTAMLKSFAVEGARRGEKRQERKRRRIAGVSCNGKTGSKVTVSVVGSCVKDQAV